MHPLAFVPPGAALCGVEVPATVVKGLLALRPAEQRQDFAHGVDVSRVEYRLCDVVVEVVNL